MDRYRSRAASLDATDDRAAPAPGRRPATARLGTPPPSAPAAAARPTSGARELDLGDLGGVTGGAAASAAPELDPFLPIPTAAAPIASLQRKAYSDAGADVGISAASADPVGLEAAAARGVATPTAPLPHADRIAASFGAHDVGGIRAHTDAAAGAAARDMGAAAFATGDHVVLADQSLHTVAHEAAHVVQQRAGVHRKAGDDGAGDPWEAHADRVADAVVRGESAAPLLDQVAPGRAAFGGSAAAAGAALGPTPAGGVQRMKLDAQGNYKILGGDHDTSDRGGFAAWVNQLQAANNVAVLTRLRTSLHRDVFTLADHEAIALSLVQRALDKLSEENHPAPAPGLGAQPGLANLPRDQWWKLFIEGDKHNPLHTDDQNAMRFDRDQSPGYYAAMSQAFQREVAGTDGHQLNFDDYDRMHRGVTADTLRKTDDDDFEQVPHKLSARNIQYPMTHGEYPNPTALREMLADGTLGLQPQKQQAYAGIVGPLGAQQRGAITAGSDQIRDRHEAGLATGTTGDNGRIMPLILGDIYEHQGAAANYSSMLDVVRVGDDGPAQHRQLLVQTNRDEDAARGEVNALFQRYYHRLDAIGRGMGTPEAKRKQRLKSIARLVRALHVGHYFHDANGRLNTMVLLDRLLVDAGFSPVVMMKTDIFGGNSSVDELVAAIEAGIQRFALEVGLAHLPPIAALGADDDDDDGAGVGLGLGLGAPVHGPVGPPVGGNVNDVD